MLYTLLLMVLTSINFPAYCDVSRRSSYNSPTGINKTAAGTEPMSQPHVVLTGADPFVNSRRTCFYAFPTVHTVAFKRTFEAAEAKKNRSSQF